MYIDTRQRTKRVYIHSSSSSSSGGIEPKYIIIILAVVFGLLALYFIIRAYIVNKRKNAMKKSVNFEPIREQPQSRASIQLQTATPTSVTVPPAAASPAAASADNTPSHGPHSDETGGASVNRNTSVRSIMTLPAYRPKADSNESVLGREGERGGIDVIVDMPSDEQHEAMRDEEMAALHEVRELRRQFAADEQELVAERDAATRRYDMTAVRQSRARSRVNADNTNARIGELREQIISTHRQRERSTSSVSYGELGVARHDGSRIRATSNDSERMGLLSDAASIGANSHRRSISGTSFASVNSDDQSLNHGAEHSSQPNEADLGEPGVPPPEYQSSDNRLDGSPVLVSNPASSTQSPPLYTEQSSTSSPDIADQPATDASVPEIRIESHTGPSTMHTQATP